MTGKCLNETNPLLFEDGCIAGIRADHEEFGVIGAKDTIFFDLPDDLSDGIDAGFSFKVPEFSAVPDGYARHCLSWPARNVSRQSKRNRWARWLNLGGNFDILRVEVTSGDNRLKIDVPLNSWRVTVPSRDRDGVLPRALPRYPRLGQRRREMRGPLRPLFIAPIRIEVTRRDLRHVVFDPLNDLVMLCGHFCDPSEGPETLRPAHVRVYRRPVSSARPLRCIRQTP